MAAARSHRWQNGQNTILWKYVREFGYSPEAARQNVANLVRLPLQVASTLLDQFLSEGL